jgi:hypothetical protein
MSEKKIELIAQLLAKAESTTPEEAEALTEHAERLMIKYGIEQAVINERRAKSGKADEAIVQISITFTGAYRLEYVNLGHMVANGLGAIQCLMSTFKNKAATLYLIGYESDVQQAKLLIQSLQVQAVVANREWWKANKADFQWETLYDQEATRRSFVRGFGNGAGARIAANRQQAVQEAGTGTELVLVSREAKVQEYFDGLSKDTRRTRASKGDSAAAGQGYRAGQRANTGERAMTQGRGITA